ncbi:MAG: beta-galactosidase trimerization domain-containing protein [Anaerolineae bacterium]|nr:beta-galactosidase trimerization domain-containing protein [Anaerolineae bacterium]
MNNAAESAWYTQPMRWAQLAFVETDPGRCDTAFWLDYFKSIHAGGACLSAGGYVAYYPTQIPFHYRSQWLGDIDLFGDMVQGCRDLDMAVLARTDPHAIHQDAASAHPEWIAVDADGAPRRHWSTPEAWVTCALGPYNFEFMTEVHREIVSLYQVDGIFSNRWAGHGVCYCAACQRNFYDAAGMPLPRTNALSDPAWRAWLKWREQRLFELVALWDNAIQACRVQARYIPNSGGGALSSLDMSALGERIPLLFADKQARNGITPPWANGKNAKEFRAAFGRKPIGGIFSVGLEEKHRWKDSVQSEAELRVWTAGAIANGMRPWFTKFSAVLYDYRWLPVVQDIYEWHYRNESYLRNEKSLARVAVVYSQQTAANYGGQQAQAKVEDPILGAYQALIEARIPFDMVHDRLLDSDHLAPYKVLILPNIAALSDAQCQALRDYVQSGGSLMATFETSLYNAEGVARSNFGLADIFGVDYAGCVAGPLKNSYCNLEFDTAVSCQLLAGLENAGRIIHGPYRVHVANLVPGGAVPLTLVPSYPDLPMEEVYPRDTHTDTPAMICRQLGQGRVVYFPCDIARSFWEVLNNDHALLLRNAVLWALDEPPLVEVQGPGVLDVTVWQQKGSLTIHLVNLTNPMMMRGAFRALLPVGPYHIDFRVPLEIRIRAVKLLKSDDVPDWHLENSVLQVDIPRITDHEVLAMDFEYGEEDNCDGR